MKKTELQFKLQEMMNEDQKKIVMKLIEDCGFEPYDNGIWKILGLNNPILLGIAVIILVKN